MKSQAEQFIYCLYLGGAVIVGLTQCLQVVSILGQWNHDQFGWASSLLDAWIQISPIFLVLFLVRRRFLLALSPVCFLMNLALTVVFGPFFISIASSHPELAHPGLAHACSHQQLETFDIIFSILGLFYAALSGWLLCRQLQSHQNNKTAIVLIALLLGVFGLPCYAFDLRAAKFQQLQAEGINQLQSRDYAGALKSFAAATKEHANSWQTWLNIGICHLRLGDYKATIFELQKSIKLGGLQSAHCITMSGAYEGLGDPKKAYAWLDLACKVDPTKAENPAMQAKMMSLNDPMLTPIGSPDAPDYLLGLVSIQKWHLADFPIKVFVRKNIQMPDYYEQFDQTVRDALNQWCKATDNVVKYKFVNDKETANLIFDYTERREQVSPQHDPGIDGNAENRVRFDDHSIDWSNITVLVKDKPGIPSYRKPYLITKSLLHEIGHALGLHGHSPNPEDIMFSAATPAPFATLSKRDIETIRRVYNLPPADPQIQGLIYVREKNFLKAIACFNAALKEHPNSWKILQNIGSCNMALGQFNTAIEYFERSVRQGGLHHVNQCKSLAGAYQQVGKNSKVFDWLETACSIDPATAGDPQVRAEMKRLAFAIDHPSGPLNSADYLAGIFKVSKWSKDSMPLKVFVKQNSRLSCFQKEFTEIVRNALDQWCQATNDVLSYEFVDKEDKANLIWNYTDNEEDCKLVAELGLDGATDLKIRAINDKPELATIAILVKDKPGATFRDRQVLKRSCLHETGHALGMNGHSPNVHDVMFSSANTDGKVTLSERDKNTIRKLYQP